MRQSEPLPSVPERREATPLQATVAHRDGGVFPANQRPLAIDLFTGLHGFADGLIAEGFRVIGVDIEDMSEKFGQPKPDHFTLLIQDVLTLNGAQFKDASLIVASPPCQEYSYMAMPWSRAKQIKAALLGGGRIRGTTLENITVETFPKGYKGSRTVAELTALFDACFRIQREASAAAGRHIPMVVENVRGAQPWVGRARWAYGSFFLWGDVPALMPITQRVAKVPIPPGGDSLTIGFQQQAKLLWKDREVQRLKDSTKSEHYKSAGMNWSDQTKRGQDFTRIAGEQNGVKVGDYGGNGKFPPGGLAQGAIENGVKGFTPNGEPLGKNVLGRKHGSKSNARKAASAMIAKIPFALSSWIARVYFPKS